MEQNQLYNGKERKEESGKSDKNTQLGKQNVQHGPTRDMTAVLACNKCQVAINGVVPLKKDTMDEQVVGIAPDSWISDEKNHRDKEQCANPPSPWHGRSLLAG